MNKDEPRFLKCFIAAIHRRSTDEFLVEKGFADGLVVFAIPDYGIMFRCRAQGSMVDLEFGAFFALLRFIKTRLSDQDVKAVHVFSSHPELVFAFTGRSRHIIGNEERQRLLRQYGREFKIAVGFVKPHENQAHLSPADMPAVPKGTRLDLDPRKYGNNIPRISDIHKGIDL